MSLLLTHGYFLEDDPKEMRIMRPYPPLGILYITAYLKSKGFAVEVFDSTFQTRRAFRDKLAQEKPQTVGIYCNLMTKLTVLEMIREAREAGAEVIVGGPEPPHYAEEFLHHGADVVVIGEGEMTLEALLPVLSDRDDDTLSAIEGIAFKNTAGDIVRTPDRAYIKDVNALPAPDRSAIDIRRYMDAWKTHHGMSSLSIITARGCPYRCSWCSHTVFGESHRRRTPELIADEIAQMVEVYQPDALWFADDVFTISHKWLYRFAEEMKARHLHLPFECISRADRLNEKVIKTLSELGCRRIWLGSESGSQRMLDAMRRDVTVDCIRDMTQTAQRYGIEVGLFVMLGYDGEEISDIEETVDHLKKTAPDTFLTTVSYPIKGTPYYREIESHIIDRMPWQTRTERDLTIAGRYSDRFYRYADRWMVHDVAFHKAWHGPHRNYKKAAKAFVNARIGRWGMRLTSREKSA